MVVILKVSYKISLRDKMVGSYWMAV